MNASDKKFNISEWPGFRSDVNESVQRVLTNGTWGRYSGPANQDLKQALRNRFQRLHVDLCASGTIAVEFALRGLGLGVSDEVIVAGYDFPGNFRSVEAVGAFPVVVDVAPHRLTPTRSEIEEGLSGATKAVLLSHLHGNLVDIEPIAALCQERGMALIEDACQVPGATIKTELGETRPAGSFGDVSVLSFGGSKLLSAGRGGAVLTNNESIAQRIKIWSDRGNDIAPLSELQAAAVMPLLNSLDRDNATRNENAELIAHQLKALSYESLELFPSQSGTVTAYYKFPMLLADNHLSSRTEVCREFQSAGLPVFPGFEMVARRSPRRCRTVGELTNVRRLVERLMIMHHNALLVTPSLATTIGQFIGISIGNSAARSQ